MLFLHRKARAQVGSVKPIMVVANAVCLPAFQRRIAVPCSVPKLQGIDPRSAGGNALPMEPGVLEWRQPGQPWGLLTLGRDKVTQTG